MEHRDVLPAGTVLDGKYRIDRLIGAGGFGMTYEALDVGLNMKVAVKEYYPTGFGMREGTLTVRPRTDNDADLFQRLKESFLREARTLAQLRHPCIVRVLSVFEGHGTAYMIMEFEQGKSLKGWLEGLGRKPKQAELDAIVMPLTDALELLHGASFLHRDIAPDNIIVRADGSPVLLDFGAARRVMAELSGALTGIVKSGYSPQEQYANDPRAQGPWSDIYALGATLYRCVTGETPTESTLRMLDDPMLPASQAAVGAYRAGFLAAIDQALRLRPKERPQTIAEMRRLLKAEASLTVAVATAASRVATSVADAAPATGDGWSKVSGASGSPAPVASRSPWKIAAAVAGLVALGGMAWGGYDWRARQAVEAQRIEAERIRAESLAKEKSAAGQTQRDAQQKAAEEQRQREDVERQFQQRMAEAERLKREEAERQKRQAQPGANGDKLAVALDNALGECRFCDDVKKLVSAGEFAELVGLPLAVERTINEVRNRKGPQEDTAARAILEKLAQVSLEPDPYAVIKPGETKCTTYYFGFLDNGAQRVGTHQCMVRMVQIGGELTSLTVEKTTGDGLHANIKKFRVSAPAYLGRTYLKGHAVTRYNLATPRNKENGNFGNKVGLVISLGGKPALISTNQNGFTKADDTFFEVIVLE